jgi:hypothetical protein
MPTHFLRSEYFSKKQQILITGSDNPLKNETLLQLNPYSDIQIISSAKTDLSAFEDLEPTVIIHYVGFGTPSYTTVYSATVYLHSLLKLAFRNNSRFILVIADSVSADCRSAVSLTTRFSDKFKIRFNIVDAGSDPDTGLVSGSIIKLFIYHHRVMSDGKATTLYSKKEDVKHQVKSGNLSRKHRTTGPFILSAALIAGLYLCFLAQLLLGKVFTDCSVKAFTRKDFASASHCSDYARFLFSGINIQSRFIPGAGRISESAGFPLAQTYALDSSLNNLSRQVYGLEKNIREIINPAGNGLAASDFITDLPGNLTGIGTAVDLVKSQLQIYYRSAKNPAPGILSFAEEINRLKSYNDKAVLISPLATDLLGMSRPVTYLILIQDGSRLFSSGGPMGLVVVLTIRDAKIISSGTYKTSVIESLLPGKIEAPPDLRHLTGNQYWEFSQSNWDPDFTVSAVRVSWFVAKAISVKPDAVIALNSSSLTALTQNLSSFSFYTTLMNLLESRQLFFYPLTFASSAFDKAGYSGRIILPECRSTQTCTREYLYRADSDLDMDKPSSSIIRQDNLEISLSRDLISSRLTSSFTNSARDSRDSPVSARIYRKIYIPTGSELISSRLNGRQISPDMDETATPSGLIKLGFLIDISADSQSVLELEFTRKIDMSGGNFHFQVDIPNQPGAQNPSSEIKINYPLSWFATAYGNPPVASPGTLSYNTPSFKPTAINIDFSFK